MQSAPPSHFTAPAPRRSHVGRLIDPCAQAGNIAEQADELPAPPPPAWLKPQDAFERAAYVTGWRSGCFHGTVLGLLLGAALVAGALQLGMSVGA